MYLEVGQVGWNRDQQIIAIPDLSHSLLLRLQAPDYAHALQLHGHASMLPGPPVMELVVEVACNCMSQAL